MPFDPTKPAFASPDSSAEMRDQLNARKALFDAQAATLANLQAQIAAALGASSNNSNGVGTLGLIIGNNPPQQSEVQPIADKLDELINALRR